MPFHKPPYIQYTYHGLTFIPLKFRVPVLFADYARCRFMIVQYGFPLAFVIDWLILACHSGSSVKLLTSYLLLMEDYYYGCLSRIGTMTLNKQSCFSPTFSKVTWIQVSCTVIHLKCSVKSIAQLQMRHIGHLTFQCVINYWGRLLQLPYGLSNGTWPLKRVWGVSIKSTVEMFAAPMRFYLVILLKPLSL